MTGKDIKKIRLKLMLLQTELAEQLGVSIATVRFWEEGKRGISILSERKIREFCKKNGIKI